MKILHVVALIQASTGGPAVSVTRLASEQARLGHEVTLACLDYPHLGPQVAAPGVRVVSVKGNALAVRGRGWCPAFRRVLREEAAKADIVHNHGLWMWPNAYAREAAVAAGKPLVISPRGMLEAWSLNRSKLRKTVAWWLFERKNLHSAAMFHATAESEAESIRHTVDGMRHAGDRRQGAGDGGQPSSAARLRVGERQEPEAGRPEMGRRGDQTGFREDINSREEAQEDLRLTDLKLKTTTGVPVVVAPNGVDLPDLGRRPGRGVLEERFPELKDRRWVVFMSRLHPKKGIDVLLRAWGKQKACGIRQTEEWPQKCTRGGEAGQNVEQEAAEGVSVGQYFGMAVQDGRQEGDRRQETETPATETLSHRRSVLVLAGSDLVGYRKGIERMVRELGLEDSVVITGEVQGEMKDCLLANAEVFVLPSYSENFGIVVAEAMAWGRPVIASTGTPWKEVADCGAGWWVEPEEAALAKALAEALGKGQEELEAMGAKGRVLVEERYTWAAPATKLIEAYGGLT